MGFYTGRTGSLSFENQAVAKVRDWSLDTTVELLDTTVLGDFASTYTPGVKGATGSATLMYYRGEAGDGRPFTVLLNKVMRKGPIERGQSVELELNVGGGGEDTIRFNAYITSAQVGASTGELSIVPIQFTVDGDFLSVIS